MIVLPLMLPLLLTASGILPSADAKKLPSFITKCSINDTNLDQCALENGRKALPSMIKGNPTLHLPELDPLKVTAIDVQAGNGPNAINMSCRNIVVSGFASTNLDKIQIDHKNGVYNFHFTIPRIEIISDYTVNGKILVLPIKGNGKANFTFENGDVSYKQEYTLEKREGHYYYKFTASTARFNCSQAYFNLENLFDGDKQLGGEVNKMMNNNWRDIMNGIGQPFVDAAAGVALAVVNTTLQGVPYDEVFDDVDVS